MAMKFTLGPQAISALSEQARRFDNMSVYLAKSANIATSQAEDIAKWASKLVNAVTKIQQETQRAAETQRKYVQDKVSTLKTQSDSTKRKILEAAELDSSRTIKANFRMIFGPPRDAEYKSRSTKSMMTTNLVRIDIIRRLCESNPHSVITLSTTLSTKVWTEASPDVFDGLIKLLKDETEQDWPEEIIDIMTKLEAERPMSSEFKIFRGIIESQHSGNLLESEKYQEPLNAAQNVEQDDGSSEQPRKRRHHDHSSAQEIETETQQLQKLQAGRQLHYVFSKAPIDKVLSLGKPLSDAIQAS